MWHELLINRKVSLSSDLARMTRGDVIHCQPCPCKWSEAELIHPDWMVIKVDIEPIEAQRLKEPHTAPDGTVLHVRRKNLLLSDIEQEITDTLPTEAAKMAGDRVEVLNLVDRADLIGRHGVTRG